MQKNAGSLGKGLRFCSALLAVLSFSTTIGSVAVMAEEVSPAAAEETPAADSGSASSETETTDGAGETTADSDSGAGSDTAADEEENTGTDAASGVDSSDSDTDACADDADTDNSGLRASVDVAADGSVSGTTSDGASISVDADGSAVIDLSGIERSSTQTAEDGSGYTDPATGATVYRMEDFLGDEDEPVDYVDDTDAFMAWMDAPTMTAEELSDAMEEANEFDQAVLQNCYEPVEDSAAVQSAPQPIALDGANTEETAESAEPQTTSSVTYRLKDEYAAPAQADDTITFLSNDNDAALLDADAATTTGQSATFMVVDNSSLYLHIVDEDGRGIDGASVTYSLSGGDLKNGITKTLESADGTAGSSGMLKLDVGALETESASLFLNVSREGYYGITRMDDIVNVGTVLTYTLCKHTPGVNGFYLRGSYIDGVDTKNGYTVMLTAANTNKYDITAIVGTIGDVTTAFLPNQLTMSTTNEPNPGYPKQTFTSNSKKSGSDYAIYSFNNSWSHYEEVVKNATLRKGDALQLDQIDNNNWITFTKNQQDPAQTEEKISTTVSMGITADLPDLDRIGFAKNISFGLCGGDGAKIKLDDDFLGGDSTISTDLLTFPVFVYVSLQGSLLLGFGPLLNLAEAKWLQEPKNDPQAQNPGAQAKTETLISRIKSDTVDSFSVKDNYSNKQKKRAALNDKMKDLKKNDKKVMATGSGSIDWNGAVFIFGRIDPRNYLLSADLGLSMMWSGSLQYTDDGVGGTVPVWEGRFV